MIKVSIIVPVYNVGKYLEKCLFSIVNQTLKEIEIIIVNDGSTDNSIEIINNFRNTDKRIRVINKENEGLLAARGDGIKAANGKYILNIDGDDWIERECCELMYNCIENSKTDMIICDYYSDYKNKSMVCKGGTFDHIDDELEYLKQYLTGNIKSYIWIKMIKRSAFENINFSKKISLGEDCYLTLMLSKRIKKISKLDKPLIHYIIRDNSLTKKYDESIYNIWDIIEEVKKDDFFVKRLKNMNEEMNYFIYNHTFLGRVIEKNSNNFIHKDMYRLYMKQNIKIFRNKYYKQFTTKKQKFLTRIYYLNYYIANIINYFIFKFIYIKNNNNNYT
ncbi:glycosyltransferase family 2 protein [Clostridium perfringens]|uniref:glycosyltransferase family 2 protein n=1 Tax=Clostridium perfringens TaxID=1502 RepID=UPI0039EB3711